MKFSEKNLRIGDFEKLFFSVGHFGFFFQFFGFFLLHLHENHSKLLGVSRMGRNFDDYPGLQQVSVRSDLLNSVCTLISSFK